MDLVPHGYASKPGSIPTMLTGNTKNVTLSWGQSAWVDVTNEMKSVFANGTAYGIGIYTSTLSRYARMATSAKIEITYETTV